MAVETVFGYISTREQVSMLSCYSLQATQSGSAPSVVSYNSVEQSTRMLEEVVTKTIDNRLSLFNIFSFSTGITQSFYQRTREDSFSLSYVYAIGYTYPTTVYSFASSDIASSLTAAGQAAYSNKNTFFSVCGDMVPTTKTATTTVYIAYKVSLLDKKLKTIFGTTLGGSLGATFWDFSAQISTTVTKATAIDRRFSSSTLSLYLMQVGGDPSQLLTVVGTMETSCALSNLTACFEIVTNFRNYTQNYLPKQITNTSGMTNIEYTPITNVVNVPGVSLLSMSEDILAARESLLSITMKHYKLLPEVQALLSVAQTITLDAEVEFKANMLYENLRANLRVLTSQTQGVKACYDYPDKCLTLKQSITSNLQDYEFPLYDQSFKYMYTNLFGCYDIYPAGNQKWYFRDDAQPCEMVVRFVYCKRSGGGDYRYKDGGPLSRFIQLSNPDFVINSCGIRGNITIKSTDNLVRRQDLVCKTDSGSGFTDYQCCNEIGISREECVGRVNLPNIKKALNPYYIELLANTTDNSICSRIDVPGVCDGHILDVGISVLGLLLFVI